MSANPLIGALMVAPYGHRITRDKDGNSVVELFLSRGRIVRIVAPTFDEAVGRALRQAGEMAGAA